MWLKWNKRSKTTICCYTTNTIQLNLRIWFLLFTPICDYSTVLSLSARKRPPVDGNYENYISPNREQSYFTQAAHSIAAKVAVENTEKVNHCIPYHIKIYYHNLFQSIAIFHLTKSVPISNGYRLYPYVRHWVSNPTKSSWLYTRQ